MAKKKTNKLKVIATTPIEDNDNSDVEEESNTTTTDTQDEKNEQVVSTGDQDNDGEDDGSDEGEKVESKGKMKTRHLREVKELAKQTQSMFAGAKKDKKAKEELNNKIKQMELELATRHKQEMDAFNKKEKDTELAQLNQMLLNSKVSAGPSKTFLKKQAKQKAEEDRMKELELEKKKYVSKSITEFADFSKKLSPLSKSIKHIKSDGDCLYSAITNQLLINNIISEKQVNGYTRVLRKQAADHLLQNAEEYKPFILGEEDFADSEDPVNEYCQLSVMKDGTWGGHIELKALSTSLKMKIVIYHAYAPDVIIGEEYQESKSNPTLYLSYHQHAFTLGQHYNSVIPSTE